MVDVTHDGHDRRAYDEVALVALVLTELEVEALEELAVLVLGRDDLDDVVELLAEQLERLVVDRLGRGDHLAEREQHLHQRRGVDVDLLGEVGQRGATGETHGLAVALADAHATDRRRLHLLELLATCPLRLTATARRTTGTPEGTLGLATLTGTAATATGATAEARATTTRSAGTGAGRSTTATGSTGATTGRCTATGRTTGATGSTGATRTAGTRGPTSAGTGTEGAGRAVHHRRVGARHAGTPAGGGRARRTVRRPRRSRAARGRGGGPCPGWTRTGCCRGAGHRDGQPDAVPGLAPRRQAPPGPRARPRRLPPPPESRARGPGPPVPRRAGRAWARWSPRPVPRARRRTRSLDAAGAGACVGASAFADAFGSGLLGRGLGGRCRGLRSQQGVAVGLLELHLDGKLDRRGSRLDELAHLLQLVENFLALDAVGLGELVYSGLGHCSPSGPRPLPGDRGRISDRWWVLQTHREVLIECS